MKFCGLPYDVSKRVIKFSKNDEENLARLCDVHPTFYKLIKNDYKALCCKYHVYRLKNETWAYAFSQAPKRSYNSVNSFECNQSRSGDRMVLPYNNAVTIISLDFHNPFCKYWYTHNKVVNFMLAQKGHWLIVQTACDGKVEDEVTVYSMKTGILLMKRSAHPNDIHDGCVNTKDGYLWDAMSMREYKLNLSAGASLHLFGHDKTARLIYYTTSDQQLCVIDTETSTTYVIHDKISINVRPMINTQKGTIMVYTTGLYLVYDILTGKKIENTTYCFMCYERDEIDHHYVYVHYADKINNNAKRTIGRLREILEEDQKKIMQMSRFHDDLIDLKPKFLDLLLVVGLTNGTAQKRRL
ncbi:unnamed protein product [Bursaphelenchus okinawaensis]|uniref:F-box domain-containing protein n=1 Tax=Bursaphelenchus okinawaensis TaxID=465554 RepID=A0A811LP16_9BILA|nr:unnamed protein product [Bursaphelenchus okinawaensis]CAG9126826.1 unnamed protein product [Bursaphelenchus okinawaensis]